MELRPVFTIEGITFVYIKVNRLLFCWSFLTRLVVQQFVTNGCDEKKLQRFVASFLFISIDKCKRIYHFYFRYLMFYSGI